jgi:hypothetical protein
VTALLSTEAKHYYYPHLEDIIAAAMSSGEHRRQSSSIARRLLEMLSRRSKYPPRYQVIDGVTDTMDDDLDPVATALLCVLVVLDGNSIPEEMLIRWRRMAALGTYPFGHEEYVEARGVLARASLVTRNEQLRVLQIDQVTQDKVRRGLDRSNFSEVFNAGAILVAAVWPVIQFKNPNETGWREQVKKYLPHVRKLRFVLEDKGVGYAKASLVTASLFNEAS